MCVQGSTLYRGRRREELMLWETQQAHGSRRKAKPLGQPPALRNLKVTSLERTHGDSCLPTESLRVRYLK